MLGGAEGRGRLFAWLGAKESFFGIFYLKIRIFLSSPKKKMNLMKILSLRRFLQLPNTGCCQ